MSEQLLSGKQVTRRSINARREPMPERVHGDPLGELSRHEFTDVARREVPSETVREQPTLSHGRTDLASEGVREWHHPLFVSLAMHSQGPAAEILEQVLVTDPGDLGAPESRLGRKPDHEMNALARVLECLLEGSRGSRPRHWWPRMDMRQIPCWILFDRSHTCRPRVELPETSSHRTAILSRPSLGCHELDQILASEVLERTEITLNADQMIAPERDRFLGKRSGPEGVKKQIN